MRAVYGAASTEQTLGALPVVAGFCRRLDIAAIIDRVAPVREVARASHGQIIEALIANRLTSPTPMVHVQAWAQRFAVQAVLGVAGDVLNDDRIARALDALADVLDEVTGSVGAAAIGAFGLDVSQLHWDMTSISRWRPDSGVNEVLIIGFGPASWVRLCGGGDSVGSVGRVEGCGVSGS